MLDKILRDWERELSYYLDEKERYTTMDTSWFDSHTWDVWRGRVDKIDRRIEKLKDLLNYLRGIKDGLI